MEQTRSVSWLSELKVQNGSSRAVTYKLLSLAFYKPSSDTMSLWKAIDDQTDESVQELEQEYNRLFVGPGHVHCPPYESVYRRDRPEVEMGLVMGPSVIDVKRRYSEAGLVVSKDFKDLPDHIAVELEFMYFLCTNEARDVKEATEIWRERQSEFLVSHLLPWVSTFAEAVLINTTSPFYRAATNLLKEFLEDEIGHLRIQRSTVC